MWYLPAHKKNAYCTLLKIHGMKVEKSKMIHSRFCTKTIILEALKRQSARPGQNTVGKDLALEDQNTFVEHNQ